MIWNQSSFLSLHAAIAPVDPVASVASYNKKLLFVLFDASLNSYDSTVKHFWITYFILSIISLDTISTGFVDITGKEVSLFVFLEQTLFLLFDRYYFLIFPKWVYTSYLPVSSLFLILFFNNTIQNNLSAVTATVVAPVGSDNEKSRFLTLLHHYSHTITGLHTFFWPLSYYQSVYRTQSIQVSYLSNQRRKVYIYFWIKNCLYDSTDIIYWST